MHISGDGKFLYASNRGRKTISLSILSKNTKLNQWLSTTFSETPRNFPFRLTANF
jgi:6-phosphogluconolactonase (cycloisomerase 2 family)